MTDRLTWWILDDPAASGPENMAWDHTLALDCPPEHAILRLYEWSGPTLSLGLHEPARNRYDPGVLEARGVSVVRRPTGGRAVLHHREVTYCVVAPIRRLGGVRAAYALLNRALARGLARLGTSVGLAGPGPVAGPAAGPCFSEPAPGEVMAGGRKLVGSAQRRVGANLLQHGSILLGDDQATLRELEPGAGQGEADPGPATLTDLLGREVQPAEVRAAVRQGFTEVLPGDWRTATAEDSFPPRDIPPHPRRDLLDRYRSGEWTWRL